MWSMLGLLLLNAGLGFFVAWALHARYRFVRRHQRRGYDWVHLQPPTVGRSLRRLCFGRVNVAKILKRLQPSGPIAAQSREASRGIGSAPSETGLNRLHSGGVGPQQGAGTREASGDKTVDPMNDLDQSPATFRQQVEQIEKTSQWLVEALEQIGDPALQGQVREFTAIHQRWQKWLDSPLHDLTSGSQCGSLTHPLDPWCDELASLQAELETCREWLEIPALAGRDRKSSGVAFSDLAGTEQKLATLRRATKTFGEMLAKVVSRLPEPPSAGAELSIVKDLSELPAPTATAMVLETGSDGVQATLEAWRTLTSKGGEKPASLLLIDVDQTTHWNEELGRESVDCILNLCHRQIAESVRSNRGFDRVVRISGQQFLVFLGFTPSTAATFAAERLRQTFANTTWRVADQTFVIHISGAISDYHAAAELEPQIEYLRSALAKGKQDGGNLCLAQSLDGSFQRVSGLPRYDLPTRHHDQPCDIWNPRAVVSCGGN